MPEQVGQDFRGGEVVDGDDGVTVLGFKKAAQHKASNASKSVNANFTHGVLL
jgi:hypothetical protein